MSGARLPSRALIAIAIKRAQQSEKGRGIVDTALPHGISVDATFLVLKSVEKIREKIYSQGGAVPVGAALRALVDDVAFQTGFDSGRRRAYVLVSMQYYLLLRHRDARLRKRRTTTTLPAQALELAS